MKRTGSSGTVDLQGCAPKHGEALSLPGAQLFDPSGRSRPMKEWVQVPAAHVARWQTLAQAALRYVASGH